MKSDDELLQDIEDLAPWHHEVVLREGVSTTASLAKDPTGGLVTRTKPQKVFYNTTRHIFPVGLEGRSFLDVACNSGGYCFAAKDRGASRTYGFDIREHWINQARFILEHREADSSGMVFERGSVDDLANHDESYDLTWFSGIFYHLPDPVASLKLAAERTNEILFLNTACEALEKDKPEVPALVCKMEGTEQVMSGIDGLSWLPSGPIVLQNILTWLGFKETKIYLWNDPTHRTDRPQNRPMNRIGIAAARQEGALANMRERTEPNVLR